MRLRYSHIEALLVHCYWFDHDSKNHLDQHSNLQLIAAICLLKEGVNKIVILGGKIDPNKESIGRIMYQPLLMKLGVNQVEKIMIKPNSLSTRQEIRNYQILAKENNWKRVASLSLSAHTPRVKRAFISIFGDDADKVSFLITEEILRKHGYNKLVVKYQNSPAPKWLKLNEVIASLIDRIPVIGGSLSDLLIRLFPGKGVFLSNIFSAKKLG